MRIRRLIIVYVIICIASSFANAQKLTTEELIKAWSISDTSQTDKAEETYRDLKFHFNPAAFETRLHELNDYLDNHASKRLYARTVMYEINGKEDSVEHPFSAKDYDKLKQAILIAGLLDDKQLLAELYAIRGGHNKANDTQASLFYEIQAINIEKQIGLRHFPSVFVQFLLTGIALHTAMEYRQSINYGKECLTLMQSPETDLPDYILQLDAIGDAYRMLNMPDSVIYYYQQIHQILNDYRSAPHNYFVPNHASEYIDTGFVQIWHGVAAGGIGKGLFLEAKYNEARPLLQQNLSSSIAGKQFGDAAQALNILAGINYIQKNYDSALIQWKHAYIWASQTGDLQNTILTLKGITDVYAATGRYDSAYNYQKKYAALNDSSQAQLTQSRLTAINVRIEYNNLQTDLSRSKEAVNRQVRLRNIILMSVVFLFIIALLLYNRSRLRHNLKQERLEKEKELADMEVARARGQLEDFARNISEKNKLIEHLRARFDMEADAGATTALRNFTILTEEDWQQFKDAFEKANPGFWQRLSEKFPGLTPAEQRFTALIRLGLSNKEMAAATGVSAETVRSVLSRMRKKLNLTDADHTRSLVQEI